MKKNLLTLFIFLITIFTAFSQEIRSPERFLGYKLGEQYTPHYRIVEYFRYIAQVSKNVKLVQYGFTNEGRPLMAMFVASDENIGKLEEIRLNNLRLAGLDKVAVSSSSSSNEPSFTATVPATTKTPVICWLSYNVHGNEPA